jgi:hypothetical protein
LKLRVGYELQYEFPQPTPLIAMLNIHFSRVADLADKEWHVVERSYGAQRSQAARLRLFRPTVGAHLEELCVLGIERIGELATTPRATLALRFGPIEHVP